MPVLGRTLLLKIASIAHGLPSASRSSSTRTASVSRREKGGLNTGLGGRSDYQSYQSPLTVEVSEDILVYSSASVERTAVEVGRTPLDAGSNARAGGGFEAISRAAASKVDSVG